MSGARRASISGALRAGRSERIPLRRFALIGLLALAVLAAAYLLVLHKGSVEADVDVPVPSAVIGSGSDAVVVGPRGQILDWLPPPEDGTLPSLPLREVPRSGRLGGTMLQQAIVLGAAPAALRPHVERSYHGESGVDVVLRSGIELRFGDASRAGEKWRAAATVLADPSLTALDYINLYAPSRPTVGGSGHALPPPP